MGCIRRILIAAILLIQLVTFALTLLVLGSAGTLGKAAIISADDAIVLFLFNVASLGGTFVLAIAIWLGGRARRRQEQEIAALRRRQGTAPTR